MNEDNVQDETLRDGTAESSGSDSADNIPDNNDPEADVLTSEVVEVDPVIEESKTNDISFNVAFLFVASMIVGLLIFSSLSRKWHS